MFDFDSIRQDRVNEFISLLWATFLAEIVVYPFLTTKIRTHMAGVNERTHKIVSTREAFRDLIQNEGFKTLYNGITMEYTRQVIFQSVRIGCYEPVFNFYKKLISNDEHHLGIRIITGGTVGFLAVLSIQPTVIMKLRYQSGFYEITLPTRKALKKINRLEGIMGYFRGFSASATRTVIVQGIDAVCSESVKQYVANNNIELSNGQTVVASKTLTSIFGAIFSNPADVMRTRYVNAYPDIYQNIIDCVKQTYRKEGFFAFYKGMPAYFMANFLTYMLIWYFHDRPKLLLQENQH